MKTQRPPVPIPGHREVMTRPRRRSARVKHLIALLLAVLLVHPTLVPIVAAADVETLGATGHSGGYAWGGQSRLQISTAPGAPSYTVPEGRNAITAWSTHAGWPDQYVDLRGPVALQVWRPTATPDRFTLVAQSPLQSLTLNQVNTFTLATPLIVQPGDVLGTYQAGYHASTRTTAGVTGNRVGWAEASPSVGGAVSFTATPERLMNVSAVVTTVDATLTSLTSDPSPSELGGDVTLTATVTRAPGTPAGPAPTGSVRFSTVTAAGTTVLSEEPLDTSGVASITTDALTLGTHTLRAEFLPTGSYVASTSPPLTHEVVLTGSVTIGKAEAALGGYCPGPSMHVQTSTGPDSPSYVVPAGRNRIAAWSTYAGHYLSGVALTVWRQAGTGSTYTLVGRSEVEQLVQQHTMHDFPLSPAIAVQPGDVLGLWVAGPNNCVGHAQTGDYRSIRTGGLPTAGTTYSLTPVTGAPTRVNVAAVVTTAETAVATTTVLSSDASPSVFGQPVTFTATVSPVSTGGTPTGAVRFEDGATELALVPLDVAGVASHTTGGLSVGTRTVSAVYVPTGGFVASHDTVIHTVSEAPTTTELVSDPPASVYGEPLTLTATVTPPYPGVVPSGTVQFRAGATSLGDPVPVTPAGGGSSDGVASLAVPPGALAGHSHPNTNPHTLTAEYLPSAGAPFLGSTGTVLQPVGRAGVILTLEPVGPLTLVYPASQEFRITVAPSPPSVVAPAEPRVTVIRTPEQTMIPEDGFLGPYLLTDGAGSATIGLPVTAPDSPWYLVAMSSFTGADRNNYNRAFSEWVTVSVDQAPLTVTASSHEVVYGDPVPTIVPSYAGFAGDDGPADSLDPAPVCSTTYTRGDPPGSYPTACTGGGSTNYALSYVAGAVTVAPAPLTVTATDRSVQYSDPLPTLTVGYDGFVLGEGPQDLAGTLACDTTATVVDGQVLSPAGTYPITCSGLTSATYAITFVAGTLTVTREDTVVRLAQSNPHAVAVTGKKAQTGPLEFTARIAEARDGSYGDIALATPVTLRLEPIGSGGTITATCTPTRTQPTTGTDPGFQLVSCTVAAGTPLGVYLVDLQVGGQHYRGADASVLTVYDPSAGGTTGAGLIVNPNTGNTADIAYEAAYLKNGKQVQGRFLYISRDTDGEVVHVLKGNVMSTMAITGSTATITGKTTLDGAGNYTYVLTGIDNASPTDPNPPADRDRYGQRITDPSGAVVDDLTFTPVHVTDGNIYVGR